MVRLIMLKNPLVVKYFRDITLNNYGDYNERKQNFDIKRLKH